MSTRRYARTGTSLLEILLVLAILAMLFAIVAPAMSGARRTSLRVMCMTNLHELAVGAVQYATANDDWIIGSPSGSGAYLRSEGAAYGPAVQVWDFLGPTAHMWKMGLPEVSKNDVLALTRRFNALRGHQAFLCPTNGFQATWFSGPNAGTGPMVSYNTIRHQMWREEEAPSGWGEDLPHNWRPSVGRIGIPSHKVFCADGARFSTATISPDYDLSVNAPYGGAFSDSGAYSVFTHSWDRSWANGASVGTDARKYAFRHSSAEPPAGAPGNAYKLNLAYYDGHVETQGDLDASNPHQWLPMGTRLERSICWPDTIAHFGLPHKIITIAP